MKVLICSVAYSPNLGDGVIFENLKRELEYFGVEVDVFDIAGRHNYPTETRARNSAFYRLPSMFRRGLVFCYFSLKYIFVFNKVLRDKIVSSDLIIIGGGQLVSDVDLNFPTKLYMVSRLVSFYKKPCCVFSVGVSAKISRFAGFLWVRAFRNFSLKAISVRDNGSKDLMLSLIEGGEVSVIPDPGLLSSLNFPVEKRKDDGLHLVCISSPAELGYSGTLGKVHEEELAIFYLDLIASMLNAGYRVGVFTNGDWQDENFKQVVRQGVKEDLDVTFFDRPANPFDLMNLIGAAKGLVAHRLHANILAHSYGVPSVGLNWDSKLKSFFKESGREEFFVESTLPRAAEVFEVYQRALSSHRTDERLKEKQQIFRNFIRSALFGVGN